ncbi:MAG: serine/threonine-protein kinase [Gemmatimonadales bacterium]|nr:serine/threonine-protein kinase [Gemmatimonadales bacterium]
MSAKADFIALQEALVGRYSLERELGRGGMGTVYLARDLRLERPVAIKALHPALAADPNARARFLSEARTAARLAHPHIIPIYAVEESSTAPLLVMAMIDGETLGARLRTRGPLPADDAARVVREIAWALDHAHANGVVHRDLTLDNILLERHTGRALLGDFGLAHRSDDQDAGPVFGTPGYLAPELIRGEAATPASDLYALGVVGWATLTGRLPFAGETSAVLAKHLMQPAPALAPLAHGASPRLVAGIMQCLAKDPDARPASATALLGALERAPEPIAIAPPLRGWFTRWERIAPIYSIATPLLALQTWLLATAYYRTVDERLLVAMMVSTALSLSLIPIVAHCTFELAQLRRLRGEGFSLADIRAALPHWRASEQVQQEREGMRPLASRVIRDLTVVFAVTILIDIFLIEPNIQLLKFASQAVRTWVLGLTGFMPALYLFTMIGVGIGFVSPGFRLSARGRVRRLLDRFWHSRLAEGVAAFAASGQRAISASASTLHRPTEMVLGLAVDDLWRAIPESLRADLGDVPSLAHTLERGATELRGLITSLQESEASDDISTLDRAGLVEARHGLEARHRETIATLERVRLQLLRLLADRQQTGALTQQLEAARTIEASLHRDVAGHAEVRRLLQRPRRPTGGSTPTPTPPPTRVAA